MVNVLRLCFFFLETQEFLEELRVPNFALVRHEDARAVWLHLFFHAGEYVYPTQCIKRFTARSINLHVRVDSRPIPHGHDMINSLRRIIEESITTVFFFSKVQSGLFICDPFSHILDFMLIRFWKLFLGF